VSASSATRAIWASFFFIELATRRVHLTGGTVHADSWCVAPQARQIVWILEEDGAVVGILLHEDGNVTAPFDTVSQPAGLGVIRTPFQALSANAYAERWVRTAGRNALTTA
jgi:putative transposase